MVGVSSFLAFPNGRGGFCCSGCARDIWGEERLRYDPPRRRRSIQERFAARRHRKSVLGFWCAVVGAGLGAVLGYCVIQLLGVLL